MYTCRICGSKKPKRHLSGREMMFGTRERFDYVQCEVCESLQIAEIPDLKTMQRHYPDDYYSSSGDQETVGRNKLKSFLQSQRDNYELGANSLVGFVFAQLKPLPVCYRLFRILKIAKGARILDVGCGGGAFLDFLASKGFHNVRGADPFNTSRIVTKHGAVIDNCDIHSVEAKFDVVMFHHSLEHVADPVKDMQKAYDILSSSGICIVRIPTSSSLAWERYGENWVQLDSPRHITIPSREGMKILGERTHLALEKTIDDSTSFQFWGSEQYSRDISLFRNGVTEQAGIPAFEVSEETMRGYDRETKLANSRGVGDQAAFIYRKR